jgi:hypothetical protein
MYIMNFVTQRIVEFRTIVHEFVVRYDALNG